MGYGKRLLGDCLELMPQSPPPSPPPSPPGPPGPPLWIKSKRGY
jgi:hypothetical protein